MKNIFFAAMSFALLFSFQVQANDSGIYTVQPFGAQADLAAKSFTLTGQYAQEFKKLLPPGFSVITGMQPELKGAYEKNFRGLILRDAAGRALIINCSSAEIGYANEKSTIKEKAETSCSFQIVEKGAAEEIASQKIPVQESLQKAGAANRIN